MKKDFRGKCVILDAGHGGVIDKVYQTPGKRSYFKGGVLVGEKDGPDEHYYEGQGNRKILAKLAAMLAAADIDYFIASPGDKDTGLKTRCDNANYKAKQVGVNNCLYVSIHSDAHSNSDAHGWSVFTSPGQTDSDAVATECYEQAKLMWPDETFRLGNGDGDPDKEEKFYVLVNTKMRAILVENFFMTNHKDYTRHLKTEEGLTEIATVLFHTIYNSL